MKVTAFFVAVLFATSLSLSFSSPPLPIDDSTLTTADRKDGGKKKKDEEKEEDRALSVAVS